MSQVIKTPHGKYYYFTAEENWLPELAKLVAQEVLTLTRLGHLTAKTALEAVVAQYGVGAYEIVPHGTALHIHKKGAL